MDSSNEISKVNFDPGWNDPPNLSFTAQSTPNRPRNFLNKRVAFPLSGSTPNATPLPPLNLPPILPNVNTPPVNSNPKTTSYDDDVIIDSESALQEVKSILLEILSNSSELEQKSNDIKKRISIMEELWLNDKLNKRIHQHMKDLAYALRDDEPQKADNIHRIMMVDHVSAVGSWMPGIKQLIYTCIARCELLAIDEE